MKIKQGSQDILVYFHFNWIKIRSFLLLTVTEDEDLETIPSSFI